MTPTQARHQNGFQDIASHASAVEGTIVEAKRIREAIDDLAHVQNNALLATFGIEVHVESNESEEEAGKINDESMSESDHSSYTGPEGEELMTLLQESHLNWFEFCERVETQFHTQLALAAMEALFSNISKAELNPKELQLTSQSYDAYLAGRNEGYEQDRIARGVNGEIVSESESDDPEEYTRVTDPLSDKGKSLIVKKRAAIQRRAQRLKAPAIAQRNLLRRKSSKRVSTILTTCPNIGNTIESFVKDHNVGADAWRLTGLLTFDGNVNVNVKEKVTYEKIRQHLQKVYQRKFSYGTVVELCIPRNRRRRSARSYRGVAKITTRRAHKGFSLRYNPDCHWSSALYRNLNTLQYVDGVDMVNINWDDATGFRLDTLTTCKQYATPAVQGRDILTTRTDYVNKYPSVLQTSSYNFTATDTTPEMCVGIVKAPKLHLKNPARHAADLEMLETKPELLPVFTNLQTGCPKSIDCIRVDGAVDEGPSHEEVQFY